MSPSSHGKRKLFGGKGPPRVPDPGQRVRLLGEDENWRGGFRAITGPLSDENYGFIIWVAEEEEWETATLKRRPAVGMPWPLDRLEAE